jgi:protein gp37
MAVMRTHISWTDSTWNPSTGCTKVSAGCLHCDAEHPVEVRWGGDFSKVVAHPERIAAVRKFKPLLVDGQLVPRRVFVNSMSDLMHEAISDRFRDLCFDAIEQHDLAVFQVLTKRPMTMRRYIERRYGEGRMPRHIWLGASVERQQGARPDRHHARAQGTARRGHVPVCRAAAGSAGSPRLSRHRSSSDRGRKDPDVHGAYEFENPVFRAYLRLRRL